MVISDGRVCSTDDHFAKYQIKRRSERRDSRVEFHIPPQEHSTETPNIALWDSPLADKQYPERMRKNHDEDS